MSSKVEAFCFHQLGFDHLWCDEQQERKRVCVCVCMCACACPGVCGWAWDREKDYSKIHVTKAQPNILSNASNQLKHRTSLQQTQSNPSVYQCLAYSLCWENGFGVSDIKSNQCQVGAEGSATSATCRLISRVDLFISRWQPRDLVSSFSSRGIHFAPSITFHIFISML